MNTSALPASRSDRTMPKNSVTSCGVSTAVGSSKMSTLAERNSTLMISTRCWMPTGSSSMIASGSTSQPVLGADRAHLLARLGEVEAVEAAGRLDAEHDVLGDREHRHQHEVLVHHADAGPDRVARALEPHRLAVDEDLALVGPVEPAEDVHQRRLAGAVLAEQAEDFAGADGQVDRVVGDDVAEPLGDAAKFDIQAVGPRPRRPMRGGPRRVVGRGGPRSFVRPQQSHAT